MIDIVPATVEHAESLAPRMRREDADECHALLGMTPAEALLQGVRISAFAWTALSDGLPIAMYGVVPYALIGDVAAPWLLTSIEGVTLHRKAFLRENRAFIEYVSLIYPVLVTCVDARYDAAIRWMKWLGFTMSEPAPFGPHGMMFCEAVLRRDK